MDLIESQDHCRYWPGECYFRNAQCTQDAQDTVWGSHPQIRILLRQLQNKPTYLSLRVGNCPSAPGTEGLIAYLCSLAWPPRWEGPSSPHANETWVPCHGEMLYEVHVHLHLPFPIPFSISIMMKSYFRPKLTYLMCKGPRSEKTPPNPISTYPHKESQSLVSIPYDHNILYIQYLTPSLGKVPVLSLYPRTQIYLSCLFSIYTANISHPPTTTLPLNMTRNPLTLFHRHHVPSIWPAALSPISAA